MKESLKGRRIAAQCAAAALIAGGMTAAVALPAQADTFLSNNTPTVSVPDDSTGFTLASGSGSTTKVVPVTVTDLDGMNDITSVRACLYMAGGDSTCATPDPQTDMALTFTNSETASTQSASFTLDSSSPVNVNWANDTSVLSAVYNGAATSMTLNFRIRPSAVASIGNWNLRVVAIDDQAAQGTYNPGNASWVPAMPYYQAISSSRSSQNYGSISDGGNAAAENVTTGTLTTNATSVVNFLAGDFTGPGTTLTNANEALVATAPGANEYALACNAGTTYNATTPVSVQSSATSTLTGQATAGTVEAGEAASVNSCRLTNGGSTVPGSYTGTVTLTVTQ